MNLDWQKSSFSGLGDGDDCLELASAPMDLAFRESDDVATVLTTTPARLAGLLAAIKSGGLAAPGDA